MAADENKKLIHTFYTRLWNRWDMACVPEILSEDISFRGSLGDEKRGHRGFIDYVEFIRAAFPDFHNTVEELIAEGDTVVARLTYRGTHAGPLFGVPASGNRIEYAGVAIFRIDGGKIADVWVLGDRHALIGQLERTPDG